jgi:hypothetical protein
MQTSPLHPCAELTDVGKTPASFVVPCTAGRAVEAEATAGIALSPATAEMATAPMTAARLLEKDGIQFSFLLSARIADGN